MPILLSLTILVLTVLMLSCGHTDRITEAHDCYTHATTVGVSNNNSHNISIAP